MCAQLQTRFSRQLALLLYVRCVSKASSSLSANTFRKLKVFQPAEVLRAWIDRIVVFLQLFARSPIHKSICSAQVLLWLHKSVNKAPATWCPDFRIYIYIYIHMYIRLSCECLANFAARTLPLIPNEHWTMSGCGYNRFMSHIVGNDSWLIVAQQTFCA